MEEDSSVLFTCQICGKDFPAEPEGVIETDKFPQGPDEVGDIIFVCRKCQDSML